VIPEFLHTILYNEDRKAIAIPTSGKPARPVQQGIRDYLLCEGCERLLNDQFEQPFRKLWYEDGTVPMVAFGSTFDLHVPDYARFKLFLLSILWRAGVSTRKPFSNVALGSFENDIRRMLATTDPGASGDFPIIAAVMLVPGRLQVAHVVVAPFETSWPTCAAYVFMFGGCLWHFLLQRGELPELVKRDALSEDGQMRMQVTSMSEVRPIHESFTDYATLARNRGWRDPLQK
jgi:hypothetical protein